MHEPRWARDARVWLFGRDLQPLTSPDPLDALLVHRPAGSTKQRRDPAISIDLRPSPRARFPEQRKIFRPEKQTPLNLVRKGRLHPWRFHLQIKMRKRTGTAGGFEPKANEALQERLLSRDILRQFADLFMRFMQWPKSAFSPASLEKLANGK